MTRLAARMFLDRWQLFVGTVLAVAIGVTIVHAGMTIVLGVEAATPPPGSTAEAASEFRLTVEGANTLTGMTVLLGAFLTVFVVGSTIGFAVEQRRSDFALLRLSGVTAGQVRRLVLVEALIVAVIGAVAGAALGPVAAVVQKQILTGTGVLPTGVDTPLRASVLVVDVVAAVAVTVCGGWIAARRATAVSPLDALRRGGDERRVMTVGRWIIAGAALALTVAQVYFAATLNGLLIPLLLGLGVVITASVALSRLAPLLVPACAAFLRPWAGRSPVLGLSVDNVRDSVRRSASCAAPVIVLVGLVMGLQGILDTQTAASATESERLINADLIASGAHLDLDRTASLDGVAVAAPETLVPARVRITRNGVTKDVAGSVVAVDPDAFRATHVQRPASGSVSEFGPDSVVLGPGLDSIDVRAGNDEVVVDVGGRPHRLREAAYLGETLAGTDGFYIDRAIVPDRVLAAHTSVLIQLSAGSDADRVVRQLRAAGADEVGRPADLDTADDTNSAAENRSVMAAIVGLGSVYALISVLSTLAISISQRRSEFATLRLAGLTRRQVARASVIEALTSTAIGVVLGVAAAVSALVGLWFATARVYGAPVIEIPWILLGAIVATTVVLVGATASASTRAALRGSAVHSLGADAG